MTTDLRLVAHATEGDAHELAARRLGDGAAERGLADAGRADEAQDRASQLVGAALHGEILDDAFLDLVEAVVSESSTDWAKGRSFLTLLLMPHGIDSNQSR